MTAGSMARATFEEQCPQVMSCTENSVIWEGPWD